MLFIDAFMPQVLTPLSLNDQNNEYTSSIRELEAIEVNFLNLLFELMGPFVIVLIFKTALSSCYHILLF